MKIICSSLRSTRNRRNLHNAYICDKVYDNTGAGSTAPESKAEASGSWSPGCSDPGCSAPAGQNHAWCSPSDFGQKISRVRILQE